MDDVEVALRLCYPIDLRALVAQVERTHILNALSITGGEKKAAADLLGLKRTTLVEKLKRMGVPTSQPCAPPCACMCGGYRRL